MEYGSTTYSHTAFEASIKRNKDILANYLKLIDYTIDYGYMQCPRKKKKLLIFVSTIDMATTVTNHLKYIHKKLNVQRYVEDDEYEDLLKADIAVSTIGSAGTALDLPNLTTVIMTTAVASIQANIQAMGRLRKLDDSDTQFFYFTALNIPKHVSYSNDKKILMLDRAKTFKELYTNILV
jgi:superfamily II DNA or RNA helicase